MSKLNSLAKGCTELEQKVVHSATGEEVLFTSPAIACFSKSISSVGDFDENDAVNIFKKCRRKKFAHFILYAFPDRLHFEKLKSNQKDPFHQSIYYTEIEKCEMQCKPKYSLFFWLESQSTGEKFYELYRFPNSEFCMGFYTQVSNAIRESVGPPTYHFMKTILNENGYMKDKEQKDDEENEEEMKGDYDDDDSQTDDDDEDSN